MINNLFDFVFQTLAKHDHRAAKEYMSCIAEAVTEKCAVILASNNFMALLTDGSQAKKTGDDKEMVLVRTERNGNCMIKHSNIDHVKICLKNL